MTVNVTLVRHGRTLWNRERRLLGWTDVGLDSVGRSQAAALGLSVDIDRYDSIWSSDLERSVVTARLAGWDAVPEPRLREIDFGDLEGLEWDALSQADRDSLGGFDGFAAPGGESTAQLVHRIREFLDSRESGWHLVVTHGGVIRALMRMCGVGDGFPDNGTLYHFEWTSRTWIGVQDPTV